MGISAVGVKELSGDFRLERMEVLEIAVFSVVSGVWWLDVVESESERCWDWFQLLCLVVVILRGRRIFSEVSCEAVFSLKFGDC